VCRFLCMCMCMCIYTFESVLFFKISGPTTSGPPTSTIVTQRHNAISFELFATAKPTKLIKQKRTRVLPIISNGIHSQK